MNKLKQYAGTCAAIVLVCVLALGGATALGAKSDKTSKNAPRIKAGQPWLASVYSVVALAGICVVAFKNPKRTHTA